MRQLETDVAVIGAGTAGLTARREAERYGARTVLIESGPYGTTCARVGCMPSKLLIAAADAAHGVGAAGRFGIRVGPAEIDGRAVMERVRRERDRFVGFVVEDTEALPAEDRLRGRARFLEPDLLAVGEDARVRARAFVVATGSFPFVPPELSGLGDRLLTNETVFELETLPDSVAVVGTGVLGMELGQALHRLGVRVGIFGRSDRIGPFTDPALQAAAREIFASELDLQLNVRVRASRHDTSARVTWQARDGAQASEDFEMLLAASGRRPELAALELGNAGLEVGASGLPEVDPRTGRAGDAPIFFAGDVTGTVPVLHEAADEGRIAGANAAWYPEVRAHHRRTPLGIVFTDPQMAVLGTPFAGLDPERTAIGEVDYADQGRARVMGRNAGLVRVYAERSQGRLVGAEMLGPDVEHTGHLLAWAVQRGLTVEEVLGLPFYHPVVEEGIRTALRRAGHELGFTPKPCAGDLDCGPGA